MNMLSRYKGHYKICYYSYSVIYNFKNNFLNTVHSFVPIILNLLLAVILLCLSSAAHAYTTNSDISSFSSVANDPKAPTS